MTQAGLSVITCCLALLAMFQGQFPPKAHPVCTISTLLSQGVLLVMVVSPNQGSGVVCVCVCVCVCVMINCRLYKVGIWGMC